jgi:predicted RNase H-like HicB family nuclease
MQYLVVIEHGPTSYGAYVPDLPGCVAVGETREEVEALIHEGIEFHIEGMRQDGRPIPEPSSTAQLVTVDANTSLNRTRNGRPPRQRDGVVHHPSRGRGVLPPRAG